MTSVRPNLLEELKLTDYYPQKLSFNEAIKLRGKSQNGCQEQYGLEIVRRLLTFDSTAVFSVATEISKSVNVTVKKEAGDTVSDDVRQPRARDKKEQSRRKFHPMDLLVVVMNCCDDFLRQVLVEKMFANKLSIPILLPDATNGSYTLLLLALRSLVPEIQNCTQESSANIMTDTLVDIRNPVVSFIRVGDLHRSKSKLLNDLLNSNSLNTFFHKGCSHGKVKRTVSNGSIEAAWFQSSVASEEEFNCRLFTVLNLRGDAKSYPEQTQFLCQSSTLSLLLVDSFTSFKEFYDHFLKGVDVPQTKIIVYCISPESPDEGDDTNFELWFEKNGHGVISAVKYDWSDDEQMSDVDFTNDFRKTISKFFRAEQTYSNQLSTYRDIIRKKSNLGFCLDEDKLDCKSEQASADEFFALVLKQPPDCKPVILPLQGEPWEKFGQLEREQRRKSQKNNHIEKFISEKETEKRRQREIQCRSLIHQNEAILKFSLAFHFLQDQNLFYFLDSCRIKLDARSRVLISNIIKEYKNEQGQYHEVSNEKESEAKLSQMNLLIANSTIGLEHILRECGQMYEAVISEEIRMREELKNAPLPLDVIRNFPSIIARLLLKGVPLELMDGDSSNVPITWLKAVLDQINILTKSAKVFVLSIIGVQSSGKSTLLNALFGLQFAVSAGRCTKGIYCHLVRVEKESLNVEYDYVLVVDTEGLGASRFAGNSTFRDNELATFAIGLADATIINMKGENWSEMKDILQVVAYGLIRVRKTKADLELMPRCVFVHQNVSAVDAEDKNWLGQQQQLVLLDEAIERAGRAEGFPEITKFNQVIKYDPGSHSWFFPDLWNGRPPKARISSDYTGKVNELRRYLMQMMNVSSSKLTVSGFFSRMSDLWNAMLHNDFVLCFRNTQEIMSGMVLNDIISHEVDEFRRLNKLEQKMIRESVCSYISIEIFRTEKETILSDVRAAVEKNFTSMTTGLQDVIKASDICAALKQEYTTSLNAVNVEELRRVEDETAKVISVHMRKLENDSHPKVKELKDKLVDLEKCIDEAETDKLNETGINAFEERWLQLIADSKPLVDSRVNISEEKIKKSVRGFTSKFYREEKVKIVDFDKLFKMPLTVEMPQVTDEDIVQNRNVITRYAMDLVYSKSYVHTANSKFHDALNRWELLFQSLKGTEIDTQHFKIIILEVGQLLGILRKDHPARNDKMCHILPPGYKFSRNYSFSFCEFACHYIYNRSLENIKIFISMSDPLSDIGERYLRSINGLRLKTAEENISAVSEQIFDFAKKYFFRDLGELIKEEVCKADYRNPVFKSKPAFLRMILTSLGQKINDLPSTNKEEETMEKQKILNEFMLYIDLAESDASEDFFLNVILDLLKEMLAKENVPETEYQKMVENNVGEVVMKAKNALRQAEAECKGRAKEYIRIFKDHMNITSEIDFRINTLSGFTDGVLQKIGHLYTKFLSQANSSFVAHVCENDRDALRTVFEKIMGCREKCPFCSAPCSQSLHQHAGAHRANHYPTGVSGTIDIWSLFANTQETVDAAEKRSRKRAKLSVDTCQTLIGTRVDIRTKATVQKYNKWYHKIFNWNYHKFKTYKELAEYDNWDIPYSQDHNTSVYWKWFMARLDKELADHYKTLRPKIPESWKKFTWEEAKESLDEPDCQSGVEEKLLLLTSRRKIQVFEIA